LDDAYYAHTACDPTGQLLPESEWQTLEDHLRETARLAASFASAFGTEPWGRAAGLLHDIGKATPEFQQRLHGLMQHVDHKSAGAKAALELYGEKVGKLLAYCVRGHHGGLPDFTDLKNDLSEKASNGSSHIEPELPELGALQLRKPALAAQEERGAYLQLLIRMIFSCLVDADYLDTERVMSPEQSRIRIHAASVQALWASYQKKLDELLGYEITNPVYAARREVLHACLRAGRESSGFFTLTVPTGGGKTLSSLAFAMEQLRRGKRRVIYAVPFTTVTEQTADVFRGIFGNELVLEHQSNMDLSGKTDDEIDSIRLFSQNWDAPLVVTTTAQLFDSLFSNKPSRCRKLHRLAGSVLIIDEAQTLPDRLLRPILAVLKSLVADFEATAVFCTATQPGLKETWMQSLAPREIVPQPERLFEVLRRVKISHLGALSNDALTEHVLARPQALVIVNTRAHACALYQRWKPLRDEGSLFHLSALMCPQHRTEILAAIKGRLAIDLPCLVVSTSLIEAGVDIDLPCVYRAEAGLESIAQSAGRCNREGRLPAGDFRIFAPEDARTPRYLQENTDFGRKVLSRFPGDPFCPQAIAAYFDMRYHDEARLDALKLLPEWGQALRRMDFRFEATGKAFQFIDSDAETVLIPYDGRARALLQAPLQNMRQLQRYAVSVYQAEHINNLKRVVDARGEPVHGVWVLDPYNKTSYSPETGLQLPKENEFLGT